MTRIQTLVSAPDPDPCSSQTLGKASVSVSAGVTAPSSREQRSDAPPELHPRRWAKLRRRLRETLAEERGAVTAEYAIIIMAAVAFAGVLVAIMRSSEIRAMLVNLVESALGAAG